MCLKIINILNNTNPDLARTLLVIIYCLNHYVLKESALPNVKHMIKHMITVTESVCCNNKMMPH